MDSNAGNLDQRRLEETVAKHWKYSKDDDGTLHVWFAGVAPGSPAFPVTFSLHGQKKSILQIQAWDEEGLPEDRRAEALEACSHFCRHWRWPRPYLASKTKDGTFKLMADASLSVPHELPADLLDEFLFSTMTGIWKFFGLAHGEYGLFPAPPKLEEEEDKQIQISTHSPDRDRSGDSSVPGSEQRRPAPSPAPRDPATFQTYPEYVAESVRFARTLYAMVNRQGAWDKVDASFDAAPGKVEQAAGQALRLAVANGREEFVRQVGSFAGWMGRGSKTPMAAVFAATGLVARDLLPDDVFATAYAPFETEHPAFLLTLPTMNLQMFSDFGPSQAQLFAFIQRLSLFGSPEWESVAAFWESPQRDPVVAAQQGLTEEARESHRIMQVSVAQDATCQCTLLTAIKLAAGDSFDEMQFAVQSVHAAELAAAAIVMRDLIDAKRFRFLYAPFSQLIPLS